MTIRINVTGNAGAGKTTLANVLGKELDIPVDCLDSVVWNSGWRKTPPQERASAEDTLIARPLWIIDGVSHKVRQAADLVVFIDVSRNVCAWRSLRRTFRYLFRNRPELPQGCPEWRVFPLLLGIIRQFPANAGAAIHREAAANTSKYKILRNCQESQLIVRHVSERFGTS